MQAADQREHERFQRRLLYASAIIVATGSALSAAVMASLHPSPHLWAPYLGGPIVGLLIVTLGRRGARTQAFALVAATVFLITVPATLVDPTSGSSGLYMLPVALLGIAFVDSARARRRLLGWIVASVVAHRALRWASGLDRLDAWAEGSFHALAIITMSAVLLDLLHERQRRDRLALGEVFVERRAAQRDAEAEAEAALASSREKTRFLEAMSHELRTPLNAVVGYAELLLDDEPPGSPFGVDLGRIRDAGRHLAGLVADVLDVSKVESGRIERHLIDVDLPSLVRSSVDLVRPLVQPGVGLMVELSPRCGRIHSDPQKIRQVLVNLLSNAARHTAHGCIAVVGDVEADHIRLQIIDTGVGIEPSQVQRLFQPYEQVDHAHGTGLGLALCARFAELLGGRIEVDSAPGRGSTFTLFVPLDTTEAHDEGPGGQRQRLGLTMPRRRREVDASRWVSVGALTIAVFGLVTTVLVALGVLPSHLGVLPFVLLSLSGAVAWRLNQAGHRGPALVVVVAAAIGVDAHSHGFHPHAQAASLYLCVLGLFVAAVLPRRRMGPALAAGGLTALGMVALRASQGLEAPEAVASIVLDTLIVYGSSALLLTMQVRHQALREALVTSGALEVEELRLQAQALASAARAAATAKDAFLAAMSHELRAPLTAVLGYTELLMDTTAPDDPRHDDLVAIHTAGTALLALINEVLDLARLQAGAMPNRPRALARVGADASLRVAEGPALYADDRLLDRALQLLAERGAETVTRRTGELATTVPLRQGMPRSLFEPFALDPCLGRPGVGWALLKALVDAMQGEVEVHDGPDRLEVTLRLPLAEDAAHRA